MGSNERRWTPEQEDILNSWGRGMAVLAGAGTGKTTTLVEKCRRLFEKKSDASLIAVSFTERSAHELKNRLAPWCMEGSSNSLVGTIHGLCSSIVKEQGHFLGLDGDETVLNGNQQVQLWQKALEKIDRHELPEDIENLVERLLESESLFSLRELLSQMRTLKELGLFHLWTNLLDKSAADLLPQFLVPLFLEIQKSYERQKKKHGVLDFSDLEKFACDLLSISDVQKIYHHRIDYLLVDEFQDTNPLQAEILWKLARPDLSNLMVVGDPKQSIYRFRDADVSLFEECCEKLPEKKVLSWNFRSRPEILRWVNDVCEPLFAASSQNYVSLVGQREESEDGSLFELEISNPRDLAHWILVEHKAGRPFHDMALLMRRLRGREKWLNELRKEGIPLAFSGGGFFWTDPRVRELVAFLRAWAFTENQLSAGVFLRAPWVGVSDQTIDEARRAGKDIFLTFLESAHPLAVFLRPLYSGNQQGLLSPGDLLAKLHSIPTLQEELSSPLMQLWHRCEELSEQGRTFHEIVEELTEAIEEERREPEIPPPRQVGFLPVLTLHASKGLEFPTVILAEFEGKQRAPQAPRLFWDRKKGLYLSVRDEEGDRDRSSPQEKEWRELEKNKNLAESKRLFYVALTRAQERLVIVKTKTEPAAKENASKTVLLPYLEDNWRGWIENHTLPKIVLASEKIEKAREKKLAFGSNAQSNSQAGLLALQNIPQLLATKIKPYHTVTEWNVLALCPRKYDWRFVRKIRMLAHEKIPVSPAALTSVELGIRVHAALENIEHHPEFLDEIETELGSDHFSAEVVREWILQSPLMADFGPGNKNETQVFKELPFEVNVDGEVLSGTMDRLIIFKDAAWIIDFKVSVHAKEAASLTRLYATQMDLYEMAVAAIEPSLQGKIRRFLVAISGNSIQEIECTKSAFNNDSFEKAQALKESAQKIFARQEEGKPISGSHCRFCEFNAICPDKYPDKYSDKDPDKLLTNTPEVSL